MPLNANLWRLSPLFKLKSSDLQIISTYFIIPRKGLKFEEKKRLTVADTDFRADAS